jgi:hypothetical protein
MRATTGPLPPVTASLEMNTLSCALLFATMMAASLHAGSSDPALAEGMKSGDLAGYFMELTVSVNAKVPVNPAHLTEKRVEGLFKDRVFASALAQRQLISKFGPANLTAFMGEGEQNERFLGWLLGHTEALELVLRKGLHTLIITRPSAQRGLAVRYLELRKKAQE